MGSVVVVRKIEKVYPIPHDSILKPEVAAGDGAVRMLAVAAMASQEEEFLVAALSSYGQNSESSEIVAWVFDFSWVPGG